MYPPQMPLTKRDFIAAAVNLAKGKDTSRDEFDRNDAHWVVKVLHIEPDDYPQIYVSYTLGRTCFKAWVYPLDDYHVDVLSENV